MWTKKASLLTGLGLTFLVLGVASRSAGALGAGLVVLSFVVVNRALFRGSAAVQAERKLELQRIYEGNTVAVRVEITNPGKRLLFVEVRDRLPRQLKVTGGAPYDFVVLPKSGRATLDYEITGPLLGVYEVGPTDLRLEDPFGLFFEERSVEGSATFWVLPRREDLRKAALLSNLPMPLLGEHQVNRPGDGFDFFALREYVPGDTIRQVNWKATARSGKMMVNQMMRTTAAEVTVFVDCRAVTAAGKEDESPRIAGARAAASFLEFVFAKKDNPRFIIYSDHVKEIEPQPPDRMIPQVLELLAELQPVGNYPLKLAVSDVLPSLKPNTPCIIISPLIDDDSTLAACSTLLSNNMPVVVISPRPPGFPGLDADFAKALLAEREAQLQELRGFGAVVIDLEPGASMAATMEKGRLLVA